MNGDETRRGEQLLAWHLKDIEGGSLLCGITAGLVPAATMLFADARSKLPVKSRGPETAASGRVAKVAG